MRHPYAEFLSKVEKPSRYVGGEYQEVRKDPAARGGARLPGVPRRLRDRDVAPGDEDPLRRPQQDADDIACERAFSPWLDCEAELRARGLPLLTLESASPLATFDVHRLLAAVRADVHQRAQPARSVGAAAARGRPRRRRAAGHRGRPDGDAPRAAGAVHRRVLHRRGRGGAAAAGARGGRAAARGRPAARAAVPAGRAVIRSTSPSSTRPRSTPRPGFVVVGAPLDPRVPARPKRALGRRHQPLPVPRRLAAAVRRGDLRSHGGRGGARLHRGVPLLPGGDDLPPGARARSGGGARRAGRAA